MGIEACGKGRARRARLAGVCGRYSGRWHMLARCILHGLREALWYLARRSLRKSDQNLRCLGPGASLFRCCWWEYPPFRIMVSATTNPIQLHLDLQGQVPMVLVPRRVGIDVSSGRHASFDFCESSEQVIITLGKNI